MNRNTAPDTRTAATRQETCSAVSSNTPDTTSSAKNKVMAACGYPGIDDHDAGDLMAAMAQARDTEYPAVGVF